MIDKLHFENSNFKKELEEFINNYNEGTETDETNTYNTMEGGE